MRSGKAQQEVVINAVSTGVVPVHVKRGRPRASLIQNATGQERKDPKRMEDISLVDE